MSLFYSVSITGDCQSTNSGVIVLYPSGGTSPYTVDWYNPNLSADTSVTTGSTRSGLSAGTYQILITDSTAPSNEYLYVNLVVSSGVCTTIAMSSGTTCNDDNGSITATTSSSYTPLTFYLYSNTSGDLIQSATTFNSYNIFDNLSADTYYIDVFDSGGCSGGTGTCIITPSSAFTYGLFVVGNSNCSGTNSGAIYVTGQTGTAPYTYSWSNGETTQSITNLPNGVYTVTVTDASGCAVTQSISVNSINPLGIINFVQTAPTCFNADGSITVNVSGGTPPYYYQLSNGSNTISYSNSITYTGLSAGIYISNITDAALCTTSGSTFLVSPNSFSVVGITTQNSLCSQSNGIISIEVVGGNTPYTYSIDDTFGNIIVSASTSPTIQFTNLNSGFYIVKITNSSGCEYIDSVYINNADAFTITTSKTDTTCGLNNGEITIQTSTGGTYTYEIEGNIILNTTQTGVTFTNLSSGLYNVVVTNSSGCTHTEQVLIQSSEPVEFTFHTVGCGSGSDGEITALITNGEPPFTLNWSLNVNGQSGIYVTGLTAGTYTLEVTDNLGCTLTKSTEITCNSNNVTYELYNICEGNFVQTPSTKTGILQLFNQGFDDLVDTETDCALQSADFTAVVEIGTSAYTSMFYTSTSLLDIPTDQEFADAINAILISISGIGVVVIDVLTNTIKISTDCYKELANYKIKISLKIDYDICCVSI
jgi:hypothetical protein